MALSDKQVEVLTAAHNETFIDKPNQRVVNRLIEQDFILETYGVDQAGQRLYFITDTGRVALFNSKLKPGKKEKRKIEEEFQHHWNILGGNARYKLERQTPGLIPGRKFRPDFYHEQTKTIIEMQGMYGANGGPGAHRSVAGYMKDCKRMNIFVRHGFAVLYIDSLTLAADPQYCIDIVLEVLDIRIKSNGR